MAGCGADTDANALIISLTQDATFPIPDFDFSDIKIPTDIIDQEVKPLTVEEITTGAIDGTGVFDALMRSYKAHLQEEWDSGRITGDDYTKAYIALTESAMGQGITFLLGKDSAYWQAAMAQVQTVTAQVQLEEAKIRAVATQFDAANNKATYALTKLRMSSESATYCISQYNLSNILPAQLLNLQTEEAGKKIQNNISSYELSTMLPAQKLMLDAQKAGQDTANQTATYNLSTMLPGQHLLLQQQREMVREQTEAQRAQTFDTRTDEFPVTGVLGKQKELYAQQITSYQRDSELKVAKIFSDSWTVQKTIDEGLTAPNSFTNPEIEKVMVDLRSKANLGV